MTDIDPNDREDPIEKGILAAFGPPSSSDSVPDSAISFLEAYRGVRSHINLKEAIDPNARALLKPLAGPHGARAKQLGKYQLLGEVARGGVGVILRAHDTDLGRDIAIKQLRQRYQNNPALLQRFVEEAQIGGQLEHPGIVPVYDLGVEDGHPYFTMKLVQGRTFAELLKQRTDAKSDQRRFLSVFEQVCHTIAYAHARGVIHRDLKPGNVMVGAFGEVQVMDWGMGKVLKHETDGAPGDATGADIIETNSFTATSVSLADYGLEAHAREINRAAAIAACDPGIIWVAGLAEVWAPPLYAVGARGFTSGLINVWPERSVAIHAALAAGDYPGALALINGMRAFEDIRAEELNGTNVTAVKAALLAQGHACGPTRPPSA